MNRKLQDHTTWSTWSPWYEEDTYCFSDRTSKVKVVFSVVRKRLRIPCRQYTDWTKSPRILQLGAEAEDSYCYSRSEVKVILITIKVQNVLNKFIPKLFNSNFIMPLWYWKLNITLVFCFFSLIVPRDRHIIGQVFT